MGTHLSTEQNKRPSRAKIYGTWGTPFIRAGAETSREEEEEEEGRNKSLTQHKRQSTSPWTK
jgi:hypothetical protein